MRKAICVLAIAVLLALIGCSDYHYTYKGENDNWRAEYNLNVLTSYRINGAKPRPQKSSEHILNVYYKSDLSKLADVKRFEIFYKAGSTSGRLTENHTDSPINQDTFTFRGGGSGVGADENTVIYITIFLDDKIEYFELTNPYSSSNIIEQNINKATEFITLNLVDYHGSQKTIVIKDEEKISKINKLVNNLELSNYYGGPASGGGIEVYITKKDTTEKYVFKANGDIKKISNPDIKAWYCLPDNAYPYLEGLLK